MKMIKNKRKGFSLVELIVVIAILAVLIGILAPTLLIYTERSRAQKDVSAMDEVVNAIQLAMSDQKCYDEMYRYSCTNNYITYTDSSGNYGQQVIDAEFWAPDGSGRATTITFNPIESEDGQTYYSIDEAIINDMTYGNGSVAKDRVMEGALIENNQCYLKNATVNDVGEPTRYLYSRIKATISSDVFTTSATYRNSSFTVFILFDVKDHVMVADVSGAFNGTNLYKDAQASNGSGTESYNKDKTPIISVSGGKTESNYTDSDLQGGGVVSSGTSDYQQNTYVENLKENNEFEYYSTLKGAIEDVNAGTIGENADSNEAEAVAGVSVIDDEVTVLLLKNHTTEPIEITANMTINLCGNILSSNKNTAISIRSGHTKIDGSIMGSEIKVIGNNSNDSIAALYSSSNLSINGGRYISNGAKYVIRTSSQSSQLTCKNCDIESITNMSGSFAIHAVAQNNVIENCEIYALNTKATPNSRKGVWGIAIKNNGSVKNCNVAVYGNSGYYDEGNGNRWSAPIAYSNNEPKNIIVENCTFISSADATHNEYSPTGNVVFRNCILAGGHAGVYDGTNSKTYYENCKITQSDSLTSGYIIDSQSSPSAISMNHSGHTFLNGCDINSNALFVMVSRDSSAYFSNCNLKAIATFYNSNSKIYIGKGNNVTNKDFESSNVIATNEEYLPPF